MNTVTATDLVNASKYNSKFYLKALKKFDWVSVGVRVLS